MTLRQLAGGHVLKDLICLHFSKFKSSKLIVGSSWERFYYKNLLIILNQDIIKLQENLPAISDSKELKTTPENKRKTFHN